MSRIRSEGTGPERALQQLIDSEISLTFEMHPKQVPGKPDFYFSEPNLAVFVDGCFWHGCKRCYRSPSTNRSYWKNKVITNVLRDKRVRSQLNRLGVSTMRIREHELKENPSRVVVKLKRRLTRKRAFGNVKAGKIG